MMKRILKRLPVMVMTLVLALTLASFHALADNDPPEGGAVLHGDDSPNFNCFLVVEQDAKIPAVTFTYKIVSDIAIQANGSTPAILAGVGTPTVGTAAFSDGQNMFTSVQSGDSLTLANGEKYAKLTVNVDFSSVAFTESGIYRYIITQDVSPDHRGVTYDAQVGATGTAGKRYLDVYVVQDGTSGLKVSAYILHETLAVSGATATDKSTGFVNKITSHNLTFGKEVTGNQGSKNKYFRFTLAVDKLPHNTSYEVDLTRAEASPQKTDSTTYTTMTNPATIRSGDNGIAPGTFYLKDGQYITIKGLPHGANYALTEEAEEYTHTNGIAEANSTDGTAYSDPVTNTTDENGLVEDAKTGFTNDRSGVVPTGILLTVTPFVVGLMLFGALFFLMMAKNRKQY